MSNNNSLTKTFFIGIWSALNFTRKAFFNLIFIGIVIAIIAGLMSDEGKVTIPSESALILNLQGNVVIQKVAVSPLDEFLEEALEQQNENPEVLLQDVIYAIENAQQDRRIKAIVLNLQGLGSAGLDKLQQIGDALDRFKSSGKPVYAIGDYYTQNQYYLASRADHIYLNPEGFMMLEGYSRYRLYYKEALAKLKASTHIFRVGTYKSAIEPYIRDDMSDAAKESNLAWLTALWDVYKTDVAKARNMEVSNFDESLEEFNAKFDQANGDYALYAKQNGWVDELKTRDQVREELAELVGKSKSRLGYQNISYRNYLKVIKPPIPLPNNSLQNVGIVVAKGTILNGNQKAGTIGGDSTAHMLRRARLDNSIKAVVLYVDSPGGSAFASEIIRQEIELLKEAGKPVVAAMSTYAASGGYWISASADQIWASPATITGSIGIFGMFMTFENTLDYLGVHTDGIGTTDIGGISPTLGLKPQMANIIQRSIEHGYDEFITLVAEERDMTKEAVDQIAQGRVWIGQTAKELGLVDELGNLDDATKAAAKLANLEKYDTKYIEQTLSPREKFWQEVFGVASVWFSDIYFDSNDEKLLGIFKQVAQEFNSIAQLNDPKGVYALCFYCEQ
ncbi:signal peptide peptidase SppA [Alteromonadaceae bacterium M269]|nr:signal peptide peptidase SppA [Alteromonadaceae bacterium M269]